MNLKKWFPFKFQRKDAETKQAESKASEAIEPTRERAPIGRYPMATVMNEMLRGWPFDERFWGEPFAMLREPLGSDRWFGDFSKAFYRPKVDVVDEGEFLAVTAELPGMTEKDVKLTVQEGILTLKGEKKVEETKEEEGCYRTERSYGSFQRNIPLPTDVKTQEAEATFDKGVLKIRFPKVEPKKMEAKPIEITKS